MNISEILARAKTNDTTLLAQKAIFLALGEKSLDYGFKPSIVKTALEWDNLGATVDDEAVGFDMYEAIKMVDYQKNAGEYVYENEERVVSDERECIISVSQMLFDITQTNAMNMGLFSDKDIADATANMESKIQDALSFFASFEKETSNKRENKLLDVISAESEQINRGMRC